MDCSKLALLCDLDGSLFNSYGEVTQKSCAMINAFEREGGLFGICTGRATQNAFSRLPGLRINGPSVIFNGAAIYDYEHKAYLETHFIDKKAAIPALQWSVASFPQMDIQVYTPDEIMYVSSREYVDKDFLKIHQPCRFVTVEEIKELPWVKCLFFGRGDALQKVEDYTVQQGYASHMELTHSSTDITENAKYLEFIPQHISKGSAVKTLRSMPCMQGRKLAGLGDYYNDIDFLQACDYAFAPASAVQEVKDIAFRVVPSNNENPVCAIFDILRQLA